MRTPSQVAAAIRRTNNYRKWADTVRSRDGKCTQCGVADALEAHHPTPFAALLRLHDIATVEAAKACAALWDIRLGTTLCMDCHFAVHGRSVEYIKRHAPRRFLSCVVCGEKFTRRPSILSHRNVRFCSPQCRSASVDQAGSANGNWKGGKQVVACRQCGERVSVKPAIMKRGGGRFCSRPCLRRFYNENSRKDLHAAS